MTNLSARYRFLRGCCEQELHDHVVWQYQQILRNEDRRTDYIGIGPVTQSSAAASTRSVQVTCLQDIKLATRALQRREEWLAEMRTSTQKESHIV